MRPLSNTRFREIATQTRTAFAAVLLAGCASSDGGGGGAGGSTSAGTATVSTTGSDAASGSTANAATSSVSAASSTSGAGGGEPCPEPTPLRIDGVDTGLDACAARNLRRRETVTCPAPSGQALCCEQEIDCGDGFCVDRGGGDCGCTSSCGEACETCSDDDDCQPSELCMCSPGGGRCVPATCRTDADCATGEACTSNALGCHTPRFDCTTPDDACRDGRACDPDVPDYCVFDEIAGHRVCREFDGDCD